MTCAYSKLAVVVAFFIAVFVQNAYAQFEIYHPEVPQCPNESLIHYKNCRGAVDPCSTCIGQAEGVCRAELRKQGKDESVCNSCTTEAAGNCNRIEHMCFGDRDCGDSDYKCIDRICTYTLPP